MELQMKKSIIVLMFVGVIAAILISSSLVSVADGKIKRGCNENTNTQTGNPTVIITPQVNPHNTDNDDSDDDKGNPHSRCV
jgi:hypothetical protein